MPPDSRPGMSSATKEVLARARRMVPPMLQRFHKGQLGRVAVIGGSEDYAGAPYFSAMASARLGCDMSHVICTPAAAAVIKTYSPNLMVHPLMRQSPTPAPRSQLAQPDESSDPDKVASPIIELLSRLHVLVIGPGLGRDPLMQDTCARVIAAARDRGIPVVLDADALLLVQRDPALVRGYKLAVLTPNVVEFARLSRALGVKEAEAGAGANEGGKERRPATATEAAEVLARELGGVTVVQKGGRDIVSDGSEGGTLVVDLEGGRKRSGGQGDTLTGSIATFLGWRKAALDGIWEGSEDGVDEGESVRLAAFAGCAVTRECSRLAFAKKGRSLQASDLTEEMHGAFLSVIGEVEGESAGARL